MKIIRNFNVFVGFMTFNKLVYKRTERKNLNVFVVDFRAGKNVINKEFKIIAVYKGKLKVCKHDYNLWVFQLFAFNHFCQLKLQKGDFFAVEAQGKLNKDDWKGWVCIPYGIGD